MIFGENFLLTVETTNLEDVVDPIRRLTIIVEHTHCLVVEIEVGKTLLEERFLRTDSDNDLQGKN